MQSAKVMSMEMAQEHGMLILIFINLGIVMPCHELDALFRIKTYLQTVQIFFLAQINSIDACLMQIIKRYEKNKH